MEPEISGRGQRLGRMGKRLLQWVGSGEEQATKGIPPLGREEGQCSEEGEVTAVGGGVRSNEKVGRHRSEERRGLPVVPSSRGSFSSRLVGFPQTSSERNGCQACLSPWSQEEDGLSRQLGPLPQASTPRPQSRSHTYVPPLPERCTAKKSGERVLGKALSPWGEQLEGGRRRDGSRRRQD